MARTIQERESLFFSGELGDAPQLDLHGEVVHEALHHLESFLHQEFMQGIEVVQIVHGRGTGVLREAVHRYLKESTIVEAYRDAESPASITGMTLAILHPNA